MVWEGNEREMEGQEEDQCRRIMSMEEMSLSKYNRIPHFCCNHCRASMFQSTKTFDLDFLCPIATLSHCTVALFESQWESHTFLPI